MPAIHIICRREDIRTPGGGLVIGLLNQPGGATSRATPSTVAHSVGDQAEVDYRTRSRSTIRDS